MEDTLKPGMDSIDVELSKPSTNKEAQAYCATVISNLEGWRGWALPGAKEGGQITIIHLDTRVRRLENRDGINPPPPMDMPSWDSLSWRVARLHRKMLQAPVSRRLYSTPPHITATLELLRSTVASIGGVGPQSWAAFIGKEESLEGDGLVQAAAQFLCYLAGKRGYKTIGSFGLQETCIMALDLSLDVDANSGPQIIQVTKPKSMGAMPPKQVPLPVQKVCCGCCGCHCHSSSGPKPGVLRWATKKYYKEKQASRTGVKARIAGVFRRLAFWKRRCEDDTDSDASSTTSGSSSTVA
ncbi:hypothetical protein FHL15_007384 [Xylaria flabelliformis]|uniref:Uncharacterized protein n=1 Tax=Xylaria flabelliformis TaxID=2512241 RepID=A0A553HV52_9PEZI|nr:hypothetical protein FHL15_007384 [Xylaria flabelliformis]